MVPRPPVSRVPIANPSDLSLKVPVPSPPDREDICQGFIPDLVNGNPEFATVLKVVRTLGRLRAATRVTCHGE